MKSRAWGSSSAAAASSVRRSSAPRPLGMPASAYDSRRRCSAAAPRFSATPPPAAASRRMAPRHRSWSRVRRMACRSPAAWSRPTRSAPARSRRRPTRSRRTRRRHHLRPAAAPTARGHAGGQPDRGRGVHAAAAGRNESGARVRGALHAGELRVPRRRQPDHGGRAMEWCGPRVRRAGAQCGWLGAAVVDPAGHHGDVPMLPPLISATGGIGRSPWCSTRPCSTVARRCSNTSAAAATSRPAARPARSSCPGSPMD